LLLNYPFVTFFNPIIKNTTCYKKINIKEKEAKKDKPTKELERKDSKKTEKYREK